MRLLIAEDERSLSKALTVILEKNNYSVDAAYDGEEALDYLSVGQYDGVPKAARQGEQHSRAHAYGKIGDRRPRDGSGLRGKRLSHQAL